MRLSFGALLVAAYVCLAPQAVAAQSGSQRPYVASSRGEVFYWVGCDSWRSLAPQNLRWFETESEARAAGYRPSRARGCAPPDPNSDTGLLASGACTVERIVDGDTLVCQRGGERIRLLMIDAPEMDQGDFGTQSRAALRRLLPSGTAAQIELDVRERDRYGRILAYLYLPSGAMVNEILVREGFALPLIIAPNLRHAERIRSSAEQARIGRAGLWAADAFDCTPVQHRADRCK